MYERGLLYVIMDVLELADKPILGIGDNIVQVRILSSIDLLYIIHVYYITLLRYTKRCFISVFYVAVRVIIMHLVLFSFRLKSNK